jgi:hypothetical protein
MMPSPELLRLMLCSAPRSDAQWNISPYFHERLVASLEMDNGCQKLSNIEVSRSKVQELISKNPDEGTRGTDLPTGFAWKSRNLHPMWGTSGTRGRTIGGRKVGIPLTRSTSELDN